MTPTTQAILTSKQIREFDLNEFMLFIEEQEPKITLKEFRSRLWDEITDNYSLDFEVESADIHCIVTVRDI